MMRDDFKKKPFKQFTQNKGSKDVESLNPKKRLFSSNLFQGKKTHSHAPFVNTNNSDSLRDSFKTKKKNFDGSIEKKDGFHSDSFKKSFSQSRTTGHRKQARDNLSKPVAFNTKQHFKKKEEVYEASEIKKREPKFSFLSSLLCIS